MAKLKRRSRWSLLLIREADRPVSRFQFSRKTVVALPAAAVLTVAGCFVWSEMQSLQRIHELEASLASESQSLEQTVESKTEEIAAVQKELDRLTSEAAKTQARIEQLHALENKLKTFIDKYGSSAKLPMDAAASAEGLASDADGAAMDGLSLLASQVPDEFGELSALIDTMTLTMEASMQQAEEKRLEAASVPSGWPTVSRRLTSGFGYRTDPFTGRSTYHAGIDIAGETGDPVYAAGEGTVKETGFHSERGNYIILTHRNGVESWYMHLRKIGVKEGEKVERGDLIGQLGNTGRSTGPHLHFQVVVQGEPVSPLPYLRLVKED
ncbi:peptidoglycan DD-metalloendopeptidase family protein [Cohnella nanjingensis]|uniref:Peptidoglycan DD-metalloendopeptidase family protein n=1 Tax=Cohnella nanjingensis TaxID=1387779 RepID=A0A7X0VFV7_9BACL|nr:peptidoglycan DD-metalloendopeptidase family protein [Cohnella nanjingensis]MBB6671678.1 peptidoglycan DD-metalloendopeptidase family protein [Cohnella nanjingensis]